VAAVAVHLTLLIQDIGTAEVVVHLEVPTEMDARHKRSLKILIQVGLVTEIQVGSVQD
jgi:hypothetical protein